MTALQLRELENLLATRAVDTMDILAHERGILITDGVRALVYSACTAVSSAAICHVALHAEAGIFDPVETKAALDQIVREDRRPQPKRKSHVRTSQG